MWCLTDTPPHSDVALGFLRFDQEFKLVTCNRFGQKIRNLLFARNVGQVEMMLVLVIADELILDVDVFGSTWKFRVHNQPDRGLRITSKFRLLKCNP